MGRHIAFIVLALSLAACSTIDRGFYDHVRVDSVPQGATASFTYIPSDPVRRQPGAVKRLICEETPCAFEIPRTQKGIVRLEKEGFAPAEYFVAPSRYRAGGGVDMGTTTLLTTASSLGSGLTAGLATASLAQFSLSLAYAIPNVFYSALGNTGSLTPVVNTPAYATAGTGIGVGIAAGSMLIDMGTAANKNTYPNPVVIGMADAGTDAAEDPFVSTYYDLISKYRQRETLCRSRKKRNEDGFTCGQLNRHFKEVETRLKTLEDDRNDQIKALIEEHAETKE
ncbi:MAG: hypothetical protein ACSHX3_03660 [Litorimonas sp.]